MTRFLYIADTHLGGNPMVYQQQKGYPERLAEILRALREYVCAGGGVDFILHGGDMIDCATDEQIGAAADAFDLPVPVHLCLGNHDLTPPDAVERWSDGAPRFFAGGGPEYTVATEDCIVHVVPNHWDEVPYHWAEAQDAHFSADQIKWLTAQLNTAPDLPRIILTHSPAFGLPVEQTGLGAPLHAPQASFTDTLATFAAKHPNIHCVLGAHNHMNMRVRKDGVEYVTVSSLVETPFEFKLFSVTAESMEMSTLALENSLPFRSEYDASRGFVQGRAADRTFCRPCTGGFTGSVRNAAGRRSGPSR